jgi:hypothetical protein
MENQFLFGKKILLLQNKKSEAIKFHLISEDHPSTGLSKQIFKFDLKQELCMFAQASRG